MFRVGERVGAEVESGPETGFECLEWVRDWVQMFRVVQRLGVNVQSGQETKKIDFSISHSFLNCFG